MKLQIDIENKTIKVESSNVNLEILYGHIKKLLPKGEWKEYSLETDTTIHWYPMYNPINIEPYTPPRPYWEYQPMYIHGTNDQLSAEPSINCSLTDGIQMDSTGIYNIEIG